MVMCTECAFKRRLDSAWGPSVSSLHGSSGSQTSLWKKGRMAKSREKHKALNAAASPQRLSQQPSKLEGKRTAINRPQWTKDLRLGLGSRVELERELILKAGKSRERLLSYDRYPTLPSLRTPTLATKIVGPKPTLQRDRSFLQSFHAQLLFLNFPMRSFLNSREPSAYSSRPFAMKLDAG